jgi:hypothetical protein
MKLNLVKWKLMLTTLPITALVLLLKIGLIYGIGFEGLVKFSEVGLVVTGGIFLIGFMLAGTMSDYKESEKIPSELACAIEALEDTVVLAHGYKGGFDLEAGKEQISRLTQTFLDWFIKDGPEEEVFDKINEISNITLDLEKVGVGAIASRVTSEQNNIRKIFSRVNVIKKTNFLSTGYALLEVLTVVIIGLLMIAKFDSEIVTVIIVSFISQIFVYMVRLIRDIDQPFEYSPNGVVGAADVDLFPLKDYYQRAKARL